VLTFRRCGSEVSEPDLRSSTAQGFSHVSLPFRSCLPAPQTFGPIGRDRAYPDRGASRRLSRHAQLSRMPSRVRASACVLVGSAVTLILNRLVVLENSRDAGAQPAVSPVTDALRFGAPATQWCAAAQLWRSALANASGYTRVARRVSEGASQLESRRATTELQRSTGPFLVSRWVGSSPGRLTPAVRRRQRLFGRTAGVSRPGCSHSPDAV